VNPRDRLWSVGRRMTDPAEALTQQLTERVADPVVNACSRSASLSFLLACTS
jgi:hypothetical protein